jgi:ribosome maturation factor RimP
MGFDLVRVQLSGSQRPTLQIMAEPLDGRPMSLEDCADLSRAISAILDVEDPISGAYSLEVSSPGIDRPLTRIKDFRRFLGHEAKIETNLPVEGRRRFKGAITGTSEDGISILCDGQPITLSLHMIQKAKLVLSDALIGASQQDQPGTEARIQGQA